MLVKYYGVGYPPIPEKRPQINASIQVFMLVSAEDLAENMELYEPGASLMLVPGTFDLEGRHVV
jgi:hypothetical protein